MDGALPGDQAWARAESHPGPLEGKRSLPVTVRVRFPGRPGDTSLRAPSLVPRELQIPKEKLQSIPVTITALSNTDLQKQRISRARACG